jgi:hypothetical protein
MRVTPRASVPWNLVTLAVHGDERQTRLPLNPHPVKFLPRHIQKPTRLLHGASSVPRLARLERHDPGNQRRGRDQCSDRRRPQANLLVADPERLARQHQNVADAFIGQADSPARGLVEQKPTAARVGAGDGAEAYAGVLVVEDGRQVRCGGEQQVAVVGRQGIAEDGEEEVERHGRASFSG